jgi:type II secretory pathway component PulJ
MRKGYTFTEMMAVLFFFPVAALVLDGLFRTLVHDIPRSSRVVQENTSLLSALEHIQDDIQKAGRLPEAVEGYAADANALLIEHPDEVIRYELKDGKIARCKLAKDSSDTQTPTVWSVPNAEIEWRLWKKDGLGYAVEVRTYIRHKLREKFQEKMANSHLYFLGAP